MQNHPMVVDTPSDTILVYQFVVYDRFAEHGNEKSVLADGIRPDLSSKYKGKTMPVVINHRGLNGFGNQGCNINEFH